MLVSMFIWFMSVVFDVDTLGPNVALGKNFGFGMKPVQVVSLFRRPNRFRRGQPSEANVPEGGGEFVFHRR